MICLFQPHQVHRIRQGWDAFPEAMAAYDEVWIYGIYAAREQYSAEEIQALGERFAEHVGGCYLSDFSNVVEKIKHLQP